MIIQSVHVYILMEIIRLSLLFKGSPFSDENRIDMGDYAHARLIPLYVT